VTNATIERRSERHTEWPEPQRGRSAGWLAVLLIVALAITLAGIFPFRQLLAQQRQVESTQAKLDALVVENERLEEEAAMLGTPAEIERVAREELGLVRPGEVGYRVEVPQTRAEPPEEVPSVQPVDERTWPEKIWDFLTGRDLAPDG
jgi:cell division protein FtsB